MYLYLPRAVTLKRTIGPVLVIARFCKRGTRPWNCGRNGSHEGDAVLVSLQALEHANNALNTGCQVDGSFMPLWIETSTAGTLTMALEDQWAGVSTLPFRNTFAGFHEDSKSQEPTLNLC